MKWLHCFYVNLWLLVAFHSIRVVHVVKSGTSLYFHNYTYLHFLIQFFWCTIICVVKVDYLCNNYIGFLIQTL